MKTSKRDAFATRTVRKSEEGGDTETTEEQAPETAAFLAEVEKAFAPRIEELQKSFDEAIEASEEAVKEDDATRIEEAKKSIEDLNEQKQELEREHNSAILQAEVTDLRSSTKSLKDAFNAARADHSDFGLGAIGEQTDDESPFGDSFFAEAAKSLTKGDHKAAELWQEAMANKTMTQASGSVGGYLVPPQISSQILELKEQQNVLRPYFSSIPVSSDVLRIASVTSGLLAGWVAELAEKPESDLSFGEISVNVFWKAGMSIVSNQLLRNSTPSVDGLVYRDLSKRLAALEEIAFISGSGVGQPLGILQTPGVQWRGTGAGGDGNAELTSTDPDDLLDAIVDAITAIYTNYFGAPNAILMHPRTWGRIVKNRGSDGHFTVGPPSYAQGGGRDNTDPLPGYGSGANPIGSLFGLPVITTRNVPTNAGDADNESRVVVGNFDEGLILDHAGISLDASEHVYFTSNQTIFRAEDAVGFTAARYPKAFYVIGGAGLANG